MSLVSCCEIKENCIALDPMPGSNLIYDGQIYQIHLLYDIASGNEITPCNRIDKPLVVYRFTGNVMRSITTLHT